MKSLRTAIAAAFSTFSVLPAPRIEWNEYSLKNVLSALPLVGVAIGGFLCLWYWLSTALQLPAILVIEGSDQRLAETIAKNVEGIQPQILTLNSLQSVTAGDTEEGMTYLSAMEQNLEVLKTALN